MLKSIIVYGFVILSVKILYKRDDLMKFKSISTKIAVWFCILMLIICAGLGICANLSSKHALKTSIDQDLVELAQANSKIISEKVETQLNALKVLSNNLGIEGAHMSDDEKMEILENEALRS